MPKKVNMSGVSMMAPNPDLAAMKYSKRRGFYLPKPKKVKVLCGSESYNKGCQGFFCERLEGHRGLHRFGKLTWQPVGGVVPKKPVELSREMIVAQLLEVVDLLRGPVGWDLIGPAAKAEIMLKRLIKRVSPVKG